MNSSWNWKAAVLGKTDREYREAFLREDKAQARILVAIAVIWALGYIYIEYLALDADQRFYFLLALRIFYSGASLYLFFKLPRLSNLGTVDLAILCWSLATVLLVYISNSNRDAATIKMINVNLAWVLGYYVIIPTRHLYKSIPALLISFFSIYTILTYNSMSIQGVNPSVLLSKVVAVIAMNVVGFAIALRLDSQRYHQYLIQKTLMDGRAQLKVLATTDSLTGIFNRRSFLEIASTEFDRYQRYGETFSFAILDLDKLKNINDTYGHPAGDHSIVLLTETIRAEKRSSDAIGRLAGDEFGLLLPNTSAKKALEVLSRIQNALENTIVETPNANRCQVSFSAGVADAKKVDESFDHIYRRADQALMAAKQSGGKHMQKA